MTGRCNDNGRGQRVPSPFETIYDQDQGHSKHRREWHGTGWESRAQLFPIHHWKKTRDKKACSEEIELVLRLQATGRPDAGGWETGDAVGLHELVRESVERGGRWLVSWGCRGVG